MVWATSLKFWRLPTSRPSEAAKLALSASGSIGRDAFRATPIESDTVTCGRVKEVRDSEEKLSPR